MARGVADLKVLADLVSLDVFVHGARPTGIDAGIYGFIAHILYHGIDTPLERFVEAHAELRRHCRETRACVSGHDDLRTAKSQQAPL